MSGSESEAETKRRPPLITVVIVNFNRCDDLREALLSVRQQDYRRVAILVVDNASGDGSREMLEAEFPEVEVVALTENLGMAGYSVGFEHAGSELLFQMDNDSLMPDPGVLREVARRFDEGPPNLAVVACRVAEYRPGEDRIEELRSHDGPHGPITTGGFHSGGVGLRRSMVTEVGSYHRSVFLYGSELFLEMKLLERGYRVHFFPEILMLHKSSGVARSSRAVYYELRNRYWFMQRFASPRQRLRILPAMLVHDGLYALGKRRLGALFRALRDGFASLPEDLLRPARSSRPQVELRVEEIGRWFKVTDVLRRFARRPFERTAVAKRVI